MVQESNAQKARRVLAEHGRLCCCAQPSPETGTCCGSIMGGGLSVSYVAKRCARCNGLIEATVR